MAESAGGAVFRPGSGRSPVILRRKQRLREGRLQSEHEVALSEARLQEAREKVAIPLARTVAQNNFAQTIIDSILPRRDHQR